MSLGSSRLRLTTGFRINAMGSASESSRTYQARFAHARPVTMDVQQSKLPVENTPPQLLRVTLTQCAFTTRIAKSAIATPDPRVSAAFVPSMNSPAPMEISPPNTSYFAVIDYSASTEISLRSDPGPVFVRWDRSIGSKSGSTFQIRKSKEMIKAVRNFSRRHSSLIPA